MTIDFFTANLLNPTALIPHIYQEYKSYYEYNAFLEYDPKTHKVTNKFYRPDKYINVPHPQGMTNHKGEVITVTQAVEKAKLAIPFQQLITKRTAAFTTGGGFTLKSKPNPGIEQEVYDKLNEILRKNKVDFKNSEIVTALLSQTEVAEIWYTRADDPDRNLRCNIFTPADGYTLIPIFDGLRDLIGFGLGWKSKDQSDKQEYDYLDVYTKDRLIHYRKGRNGEWVLYASMGNEDGTNNAIIPLIYGKIPVIYYSIRESVWQVVQPLIERVEFLISNFADTNDYNGSPILLATGDITGWSSKGESGKVIQAKDGADLKYVSWDNAPASIELEYKTLIELIFSCTQCANPSPEMMKGAGSAVSGTALERIFMDAYLKARELHTGVYGIGVQRRVNFIITALCSIYTKWADAKNLDVTPEFGIFKIDDVRERVEVAQIAKEAGLASDETTIAYAGLTDDPKGELQKINDSKAAANIPITDPTKNK